MNIWNLYAPFYDFSRKFEKNAYEKMYENICKVIKNKNVLELATGTGIIAKNIAKDAQHIDATDYSEKMIEVAKKNIKINNLDFSVQDARNLPYADHSYDVVIISNALHIMPEAHKALDEIKRILKPNGVLLAPTYIWGSMKPSQKISSLILKSFGFKVENKWTKDEYINYLNYNGWQCKRIEVLDACYPLCYVECVRA